MRGSLPWVRHEIPSGAWQDTGSCERNRRGRLEACERPLEAGGRHVEGTCELHIINIKLQGVNCLMFVEFHFGSSFVADSFMMGE